MTRRDQMRHRVSISIVYADNGVVEEHEPLTVFDVFAGITPEATAEVPATEFSYTSLLRNDGDFAGEELTAQILFHASPERLQPLRGPSLDASSGLLRETLIFEHRTERNWRFSMTIPRLTPEEWVSISCRLARTCENSS